MLESIGSQKFGEIRKQLEAFQSPTSYALKKLLVSGFVKKNQETGKYEITDAGRFILHNDHLNRVIKNRKTGYKERFLSFETGLELEPALDQYNKIPLGVGLIGDSDLDYEKLLEKVGVWLFSIFPTRIFREFVREVGWQRGIKEPESLDLNETRPQSKRLSWIKNAYDFEIGLWLNLNPRKLVKSIPWEEILSKARESDRVHAEWLDRFKKTRVKDLNIDRAAILERYVQQGLEYSLLQKGCINDMIEPSQSLRPSVVASSKEELLEGIVDSIREQPFAKALLKKKDIRKALASKLETEYKVVSKTIFTFEKANG
jgi:hypothetical protein